MPRPPIWSDGDDARLREMWTEGFPVAEIITALDGDRTCNAVTGRAGALGIRRPEGCNRWTDSDIAILRKMYAAGKPLRDIVASLDREATEYAIWTKAHDLGIRRPSRGKRPPKRLPRKRDVKTEGQRLVFSGEDEKPAAPERPARIFSEIENRRIRRFFARGDSIVDVARQMRCQVADIEYLGFRADR